MDSHGLDTLVHGLANSPVSSPTSANPGSYLLTTSPTSTINNTSSHTGGQSSSSSSNRHSVRISPLPQRRLGYGMNGSPGRSNGAATKEVDDISTHGEMTTGLYSPLEATYASRRSQAYKGSDFQKLEDFLYTRGFKEGACSDVVVIAFGKRYKLHRLILDRSPFFSCFFNGGPWVESNSPEIKINPEETDSNITRHAFELALARLYGRVDREEEEKHAMALLATASFLDLQDLGESCAAAILDNLNPGNLAATLQFVTTNYYGPFSERLSGACKAVLYRDGWEMGMDEWDGISGDIAAEIIGYDGFFVPSEWLRYCFVKDLINWRLQSVKVTKKSTAGKCSGDSFDQFVLIPDLEPSNGRDSPNGGGWMSLEEVEKDLEPLRDLLDDGIYYMHMSFEELQKISSDRDILGRPIVKPEIIKEAFWQQTELRQKVLNTPLDSPELGITERLPIPTGKSVDQVFQDIETGQYRTTAGRLVTEPPKFVVPTEDSTTIIGSEFGDQSNAAMHGAHGASSVRNSVAQGYKNTAENTGVIPGLDGDLPEEDDHLPPKKEVRCSYFPPFRFSAEFSSIKSLKEKKRVYSKTVFYAGSYWNIYIQKVRPNKSVQLGVYLHRAKETHSQNASYKSNPHASLLKADGPLPSPDVGPRFDHNATLLTTDADEDGSGGESSSTGGGVTSSNGTNTSTIRCSHDLASQPSVPAIAPYTDVRPMIQTYFKIFSPSKRGKLLSLFSSEPDSFNFSQSWGWKSSTLNMDEAGGLDSEEGKLKFMVVLGNV
ncbi:hypothetical protein BJ508DRAFT_115763 [Ascobolus immersus RN42]|uniref:BTB domain-containing protein n=1 Tax=Ascobolus immersus RN42 TaxID=1160509 RepID=A0A3N4I580_ASCIM|nr:hypothetical protein BJ508DRAFT_115763 [Ascobolus immersus RN42]